MSGLLFQHLVAGASALLRELDESARAKEPQQIGSPLIAVTLCGQVWAVRIYFSGRVEEFLGASLDEAATAASLWLRTDEVAVANATIGLDEYGRIPAAGLERGT